MRPSRGMGNINPSKMPGKKVIHRKDNPNDVEMYAKGGKVGKVGKSVTTTKGGTASAMAKKLLQKPGSLTAADMYAEGGKTKSKVNEAGNYTKPELRKRIFNSIKAAAVQGTGAGQWSARKAQLMAKRYKAAGGGYK